MNTCRHIIEYYLEYYLTIKRNGLPWWLSGKESVCRVGDTGSTPGPGKIPWGKEWKPTPVFLFGKS